jgi:hypothetical protein
MSRFLKLTNFIFNANDIHKIVIHPDKYCIHIVNKKMEGYAFGFLSVGIGTIQSDSSKIDVCKTAHSTDYNLVTDWIKGIDK